MEWLFSGHAGFADQVSNTTTACIRTKASPIGDYAAYCFPVTTTPSSLRFFLCSRHRDALAIDDSVEGDASFPARAQGKRIDIHIGDACTAIGHKGAQRDRRFRDCI